MILRCAWHVGKRKLTFAHWLLAGNPEQLWRAGKTYAAAPKGLAKLGGVLKNDHCQEITSSELLKIPFEFVPKVPSCPNDQLITP